MSKLADIFRPKEFDEAGDGVVVPMPRVSSKANAAVQTAAEADSRYGGTGKLETLPEIGAHRSEESEVLHRLLVDTSRKIEGLDTLRSVLDDLVLPFRGAMRALDHERALSTHLSRQLSEKAALCDKLRDQLQGAETKTRLLENEAESLRDALDQAREADHAAESSRAALAIDIKRRDEKIAALERLLEQEAAQRRSLSETCRAMQAQAVQAESRATQLQGALAEAAEACEVLKQDKRSLWRSAEQAREEAERVGRRLAEGEGMLSAIRIELGKVEARHTEVCAERNRLADAVDDLREQQEAERQRLSGRMAALETRATAAERQVAETRQRLIERTEEARAFICKAADATIARAAAERRLASLQVAQGLRSSDDDDPTASRTALSEFLRALNLKSREMALAGAAEKLAARTERRRPSMPAPERPRTGVDMPSDDSIAGLPLGRAEPRGIEEALNAARKADARLESEVASLRAARLGDACEPLSSGAGTAPHGTLAYEAGLVAQLRRPTENDEPPRSVA